MTKKSEVKHRCPKCRVLVGEDDKVVRNDSRLSSRWTCPTRTCYVKEFGWRQQSIRASGIYDRKKQTYVGAGGKDSKGETLVFSYKPTREWAGATIPVGRVKPGWRNLPHHMTKPEHRKRLNIKSGVDLAALFGPWQEVPYWTEQRRAGNLSPTMHVKVLTETVNIEFVDTDGTLLGSSYTAHLTKSETEGTHTIKASGPYWRAFQGKAEIDEKAYMTRWMLD